MASDIFRGLVGVDLKAWAQLCLRGRSVIMPAAMRKIQKIGYWHTQLKNRARVLISVIGLQRKIFSSSFLLQDLDIWKGSTNFQLGIHIKRGSNKNRLRAFEEILFLLLLPCNKKKLDRRPLQKYHTISFSLEHIHYR